VPQLSAGPLGSVPKVKILMIYFKPISVSLFLLLLLGCDHADLVIVGRLERIAQSPNCGHLYCGAIAKYSGIRIIQGTFDSQVIYVIHGCPELRRSEFAKGSGNLEAFHVGDYHRLELSKINIYKIGSIFDADSTGNIEHPDSLTYYSGTVDLEKANSVLN